MEKVRLEMQDAILDHTRGDTVVAVSHKIQTKTVEVQICRTNAIDEVIFTIKSFERALKVSKLSWSEAAYNFSNCLGRNQKILRYKIITKRFNTYSNGSIRYQVFTMNP